MTTVRSVFSPEARTCLLTSTGETNNLFLNLLYLYSKQAIVVPYYLALTTLL
jgi:hypothetical protein